jgi:hypothetical protein
MLVCITKTERDGMWFSFLRSAVNMSHEIKYVLSIVKNVLSRLEKKLQYIWLKHNLNSEYEKTTTYFIGSCML